MEKPSFERFAIPLPRGKKLLHRLETITMCPRGADIGSPPAW
jgi:hypothetical protein